MSTVPTSVFDATPISANDLRAFDFEAILSRSEDNSVFEQPGRRCENYQTIFRTAADSAVESGNIMDAAICHLFNHLCSLCYRLNDHFIDDNTTTLLLNPIEPYKDALHSVAAEVKDQELRAIIADALWVMRCKQYHRMGILAVDAYRESARLLESSTNWHDCTRRIERALQIAARLDQNGKRFSDTVGYIEYLLDKLNATQIYRGSGHLLRLLLDFGQGDTEKCVALAKMLAESYEANNDWESARTGWQILARWHKRDNKKQEEQYANLQVARTYEHEAIVIMSLAEPNYIKAIHTLSCGVEALRRAGATKEEIDRVHARLLRYQRENDSYSEFRFEVDVHDLVENARNAVKGLPLQDSILKIAATFQSPSVKWLEEFAIELQEKNPIQFMITKRIVDERGRVVGKRPGKDLNSTDAIDITTRATMYEEAGRRQDLTAFASILPALRQINLDHRVIPRDLLAIVTNNPFVPRDRQEIFLRGLYFGLCLEFVPALHLLVPQIENSIRHILERSGIIVSSLNSQEIQEVIGLDNLLRMPETIEIFGEDILFDLQGLLVDRFGSNLRNRLAHGLLTDDDSSSMRSIYTWALVLHLCCIPILHNKLNGEDTVRHTHSTLKSE